MSPYVQFSEITLELILPRARYRTTQHITIEWLHDIRKRPWWDQSKATSSDWHSLRFIYVILYSLVPVTRTRIFAECNCMSICRVFADVQPIKIPWKLGGFWQSSTKVSIYTYFMDVQLCIHTLSLHYTKRACKRIMMCGGSRNLEDIDPINREDKLFYPTPSFKGLGEGQITRTRWLDLMPHASHVLSKRLSSRQV